MLAARMGTSHTRCCGSMKGVTSRTRVNLDDPARLRDVIGRFGHQACSYFLRREALCRPGPELVANKVGLRVHGWPRGRRCGTNLSCGVRSALAARAPKAIRATQYGLPCVPQCAAGQVRPQTKAAAVVSTLEEGVECCSEHCRRHPAASVRCRRLALDHCNLTICQHRGSPM